MIRKQKFFLVSLTLFVLFSQTLSAQNSTAARGLGTSWNTPMNVAWRDVPLQETLSKLTESQRLSLLLDRRLDPETPLSYQATNQSIEQIIRNASATLGLKSVFFSSFVYIGPEKSVENLEFLREERQAALQQLPSRSAAKFRRSLKFHWPKLCEPRSMLNELAKKANIKIVNPELVPHDLWNETALQGSTLEILLTLLVGFDLTWEWDEDSESLVLMPLPKEQQVVVTQPRPASRFQPPSPTQATKTQEASNVPLQHRRFTLQVQDQPVKKLLETLAERLGLTLECDEESWAAKGVSAETRVSFSVTNARANELFQAILKPLQLEFRIRGETLTVR